MMFWYSAKHHDATLEAFRNLAPEFHFHPYPLIWVKSDNVGISQDAQRTPRHIYEQCLFAWRGKRPIVKIVSDAYVAPTDKRIHVSCKPVPMLKYFMSMLVDDTTSLLDPTCGSGGAVLVAEELGARNALGLEIDELTAGQARAELSRARSLRVTSRVVS
jgi:DNA modification methylase